MRKNGFQRPFSFMQMSTWAIIPILIVQFTLCLTIVLPQYLSIPFTVVYYIFTLLSVYYGYRTSSVDSSDEMLYHHLNGAPHPCIESIQERRKSKASVLKSIVNKEKKRTDSLKQDVTDSDSETETDDTKYCWVCQTQVYSKSMHCKFCDKCVSVFDHHCIWLNTCVGAANYHYFYRTVLAVFSMLLIHVITLALVIGCYYGEIAGVRRRAETLLVSKSDLDMGRIIIGFCIAFLILTLGAASLVTQLLLFHVRIKKEGVTTYEFIIKDNQRSREKTKIENEIFNKRISAMDEARLEGNKGLLCMMTMNSWGMCTRCDPVRKEYEMPQKKELETNYKLSKHEGDKEKQRSVQCNCDSEEVEYVDPPGKDV